MYVRPVFLLLPFFFLQQRVDKELANIRNKFSSSSGLSSYNRKK